MTRPAPVVDPAPDREVEARGRLDGNVAADSSVSPQQMSAAGEPLGIDSERERVPSARLRDRLLILLFMVVLSAPAVALAVGVRPSNYLNRTLAAFPVLTLASVWDGGYFSGLDDFLNENFPLRPDAIEAKAQFQYRVLAVSPNPDVVPGRGEWLFHTQEVQPGCLYDAKAVLGQIDELTAAFDASGLDFRFVIAPDKRTIYRERLSKSDREAKTCTDAVRPVLRRGMKARPDSTVDLWAAVRSEKASRPETPVYWSQDTHWNSIGAAAAARAIVESLAPGTWDPEDVVESATPIEHVGDLALLMGLRQSESLPRVTYEREGQTIRSDLPEALHFVSTGDAPVVPGSTLLIGDSFFELMPEVLAPWFEELRIIPITAATSPGVLDQIDGVDRIILERAERVAYTTDYALHLAPLIARLNGEETPTRPPDTAQSDPPPLLPLATSTAPSFLPAGLLPSDDVGCSIDTVNGQAWDDVSWSSSRDSIKIAGWAADMVAMAAPRSTYLRLTDQEDHQFYAPSSPRGRPDVAETFGESALESSGYVSRFSAQDLDPGTYELQVVMDTESGPRVCEGGRSLTLTD